jgi:V/A-type H+-transporting ATPase subunit E
MLLILTIGEVMDIQLQELIDKIKKEGVESAALDAARIKAKAEEDARKIVDDAKREAQRTIEQGKVDAERAEKAGIQAVEQASRNTILAFKDEIQKLLDVIVTKGTTQAMDSDILKKAIPEVLKAWSAKGEGGLDVLLSQSDLEKLEAYFKGELAGELKKGVEFKLGRDVGRGFRVAEKDGSAFYDFSAESVADYFSAYLNPRIAETLKNAAKGL